MATKVEYQIDMLDEEANPNPNGAWIDVADRRKQIVLVDVSKFVNPTFYFEAVYRHSWTCGTVSMRLYNVTDGVAVSGSTISLHGVAPFTRVRSGSISLSDSKEYKLQVYFPLSITSIFVRAGRIIVVDDITAGWTKAEEQVEVGNPETTVSADYATLTDRPIFKYESAKRDGTVTVYFEATLYNEVSGKSALAQLIEHSLANLVDVGTPVSGSEISVTSQTPTRQRSSAITLTDGKYYAVQLKSSQKNKIAHITGAKIIFQQSGTITKTQVHKKTAIYKTGTETTYQELDNEVLWDADNFPSDITVYYLPIIKTDTVGYDAYSELYDIDTPASVTNSEQAEDSTAYLWVRSGSISLTDDKQHASRVKVDSGATYSISAAWIVIDVTVVVVVKRMIGDGFTFVVA